MEWSKDTIPLSPINMLLQHAAWYIQSVHNAVSNSK